MLDMITQPNTLRIISMSILGTLSSKISLALNKLKRNLYFALSLPPKKGFCDVTHQRLF